jgi:nucleoside diphosphate kinase
MSASGATERSFVLLKPDTVRRGLVGAVLSRFEAKGLRIVALEMRQIDGELADQHYAEHVDKDFYPPLREFVTSGPSVAMIVEGDQAIEVVRAINGPEGRSRHDPRGLLVVQPGEPGARIGLSGIGRTRDQALVPRSDDLSAPGRCPRDSGRAPRLDR